ncbi:MAG TPA: PQQ-binding-like beta-propeller repeat protein, partial [Pirellulales bacterium]|nr:PQQ-binding-like beta-propeller repeat protein [Pirellulales bacterium]
QTRFEEAVSGSGPRATPTFSGGHLYTSGATGRIKCLDAATGRVGWSRDLVAETGALPAFGFWGLSNSPMVVDGLVVAYLWTDCSSQLRALDAETGEPVWQIDVGKNNYSSPQLATLGGERQIILVGEQGLIAVEPAAGSVLWKGAEALKAMMAMVQPHPIADSELIVTTDAGLMRLAVERHGDVWNVENRWSAPSRALRPAYNDFVVHNDTIYGFDEGVFGCIDLATGKRRWKRGRYGHGQVLLLADQELLLVTSETGAVILLAADPAACRELGRFQAIEGKTWNHPVVAHGRLYVRNAEEMACFELTRDR